jgi:hypothetical protein
MAINESVNLNFNATNLDVVEGRIKAIGGAINILGGAVETAVGLMGMFGVDEKTTKQFQEMATSAIALADGTKRIFEGYKELREAQQLFAKATEAATVAQTANNTATVAGATAFDKLRIAMIKNPLTAILVGLTALAGAIYLLSQRTKDANVAQKAFNETLEQATADVASEVLAIRNLASAIQDSSNPLEVRKKAYEELQTLVPTLTNYTYEEALANKEFNKIIEKQITLLRLKAQANLLDKKYNEAYKDYVNEINKAENLTLSQRRQLKEAPGSVPIPSSKSVITYQKEDIGPAIAIRETKAINQELIRQTNILKDYENQLRKINLQILELSGGGKPPPKPLPPFISRKEVDEFKDILNTSFESLETYQTNVRKSLNRAKANELRDTEDFKAFAIKLAEARNISAESQLETLRSTIRDGNLFSRIIKETTTELVINGKRQQFSLEELAKATKLGARDLTLAYKLITLPKEVLGLNVEQFDTFRKNIVDILKEANDDILKQVEKFPNAFADQGVSVKIIGNEIIKMIETQGDLTAEAGKELVDKFNKSISTDVLSTEQFDSFFKGLTQEEQKFVDKTTRTLSIGASSREKFFNLFIKLQQAYIKANQVLNNEELDNNIQLGENLLLNSKRQDKNEKIRLNQLTADLQELTIKKNFDIAEAERLGKKEQVEALNAFYDNEAINIITNSFANQKDVVGKGVDEINKKMEEFEFPKDIFAPEDVQNILSKLDELQQQANDKITLYYNNLIQLAKNNNIDTTKLEEQLQTELSNQKDKFLTLKVKKEKEANDKLLENQKQYGKSSKQQAQDELTAKLKLIDTYLEKLKQMGKEESEAYKKASALRDQVKQELIDMNDFISEFMNTKFMKSTMSIVSTIGGIVSQALAVSQQRSQNNLDQFELEAQERAKRVVGTEEEVAYQLEVIEYEKNVKIENEKKRFFEENKKFQIAQTAIAGFQAAVSAFGSMAFLGPIGLGIGAALAATIAIFTAQQIAAIKATQYVGSYPTPPTPPSGDGGGGGGTGGSMTLIGGQFNQPIPNPNDPGNNPFGNNTNNPMNSPQGMGMNNQPIRAYVVSSDVQSGLEAQQQLDNRRRL